MSLRRIYGLAILSGLCLSAAQAPLSLWPFLPAGVILALWIGKNAAITPKLAFRLGWVIGTVYFATSLHWIVEPFFVDVARHGWMAPFALILMAGGLALFWALPFWLATRMGKPLSLLALWPLAELARAYLFTGFPWGLLAYGWLGTPLPQIAAWIGPHGLGALTLALCALPVYMPRTKGIPLLLGFSSLIIAFAAWDKFRPIARPDAAPVIRLTQPNAPQHQKWDPEFMPVFFRRQMAATGAMPKPDLIIWPETSLPNWLNDAEHTLAAITEQAGGTPLILGAQRYELNSRDVFNTLVSINDNGDIQQTYDKHHLVPFGEYMPFQNLLSIVGLSGLADLTGGGFAAGTGPTLLDLGPLGKALPLICYEAVFPQDLRGTARADFLLHITNDAWFGRLSGPYQHLAQARFRAIEQGLPLLRSANTGISASINATGTIESSLPLNTAGHIDVSLPPARPATLYSQTGDFPVLLALLTLLFVTIRPYRPTRR